MNREDQLSVDSEYLVTIQSFDILLVRVTLRRRWKLPQLEVIDVRLGRSKNQFVQSISLSINNEQDESFLPRSAHEPSLMEFKCGRSIIDSFSSNT